MHTSNQRFRNPSEGRGWCQSLSQVSSSSQAHTYRQTTTHSSNAIIHAIILRLGQLLRCVCGHCPFKNETMVPISKPDEKAYYFRKCGNHVELCPQFDLLAPFSKDSTEPKLKTAVAVTCCSLVSVASSSIMLGRERTFFSSTTTVCPPYRCRFLQLPHVEKSNPACS